MRHGRRAALERLIDAGKRGNLPLRRICAFGLSECLCIQTIDAARGEDVPTFLDRGADHVRCEVFHAGETPGRSWLSWKYSLAA